MAHQITYKTPPPLRPASRPRKMEMGQQTNHQVDRVPFGVAVRSRRLLLAGTINPTRNHLYPSTRGGTS